MVTNKDMEDAVRRIARCLKRTCGEMVKYRRIHHPFLGQMDYKPRAGTVIVESLGSSRYAVAVVSKTGGTLSPVVRGSKKDIVEGSWLICNASHYRSKPPMKRRGSSYAGTVWGSIKSPKFARARKT